MAMAKSTRCSIAVIVIVVIVVMMHIDSSEGGRRTKKCQFKAKRTKCVEVIPKRERNKYKFCPNFDISTLGKCTKIGGECKIMKLKGRRRCVCDEQKKHRLVRDQPWSSERTF